VCHVWVLGPTPTVILTEVFRIWSCIDLDYISHKSQGHSSVTIFHCRDHCSSTTQHCRFHRTHSDRVIDSESVLSEHNCSDW
jgi:hypothetical protein